MRLTGGIGRWLVVVTVAGGLVAGCATVPRPLRAGYARLDDLARLHPGYAAVSELDRWAASLRRAADSPSPETSVPAARSFAPARGAGLALPQPPAVQGRVERAIDEELAHLEQSMQRREKAQLARAEREAARTAETRNGERRTELQRQFEQERRQVLLQFRDEVSGLQMTVEAQRALLRQPDLNASERVQTQSRLDAAQATLNQALSRQSDRIADLQRRYEAQLAALQRAAAEQAARSVDELRQALEAQRIKALAAERQRLQAPEQKATLERQPPTAQAVEATPGPLGEDFGRAAGALQGEHRGWQQGMAASAGDIARRRRQMLDYVRRDTKATVEALARTHGWRIEWVRPGQPAPVTRDITARAEEWLRAYWGR